MKTRKVIQLMGLMLLLLTVGQISYAQQLGNRWQQFNNRWVYLGEANVDGRVDHDRIMIGRTEGRFRNIQIRVDRGTIDFQRVIVHYANGGDEVIELRDRIRSGGQSRAIDLRGNDRAITSVEFWYGPGSWGSRRPRVRLYGR